MGDLRGGLLPPLAIQPTGIPALQSGDRLAFHGLPPNAMETGNAGLAVPPAPISGVAAYMPPLSMQLHLGSVVFMVASLAGIAQLFGAMLRGIKKVALGDDGSSTLRVRQHRRRVAKMQAATQQPEGEDGEGSSGMVAGASVASTMIGALLLTGRGTVTQK